MRLEVDALVEAALADAAALKPASAPAPSEFAKLATALERAAGQQPAEDPAERERFHKLALAVILDACEDPKARRGLEALTQDVLKTAQAGGLLNENPAAATAGSATDEPGQRTITIEKHQVAKGRTLFKKLQEGAPGPATETNG
ncbi:MAG: hypothetical protein ABFE07_29145 [Armatimonadia bacterium]